MRVAMALLVRLSPCLRCTPRVTWLALLALPWSARATAQDSPVDAATASAAPSLSTAERPPRFAFGAMLGSTVVSEPHATSVLASPVLEARARIHSLVAVHATWGFAWAVDGQGLGESTARAGNPMLGALLNLSRGRWQFWGELAATAPLAHVPLGTDGRSYAFAYNHTMALWGMWNQWLWSTDHMAIPVQAGVAARLPGGHRVIGEIAEATLFGARAGAGGSTTVAQLGLEAQLSLGAHLALCPRWQTVRLPAGGIDRWQNAALLRLALDTAAGRFFAGVLVDVDEPLGVRGGLGRWGFHLGKEMAL